MNEDPVISQLNFVHHEKEILKCERKVYSNNDQSWRYVKTIQLCVNFAVAFHFHTTPSFYLFKL